MQKIIVNLNKIKNKSEGGVSTIFLRRMTMSAIMTDMIIQTKGSTNI